MVFPDSVTRLLGIRFPIIQAGMVWCSGWRLASAVSNAGGLGLIGSGSMYPEVLRGHIRKCRLATDKPFGVNVPLLYAHTEANMEVILEEAVPIVFTSAGNPATWTQRLKAAGITVVHVVANSKFALKAMDAGADALVAEGFEAGGHNGREETTTLCLVPLIRELGTFPLIAAGGIGSGKSMLAAMALGADAVQVGSRFAASIESSAHPGFKEAVLQAADGDTVLTLKQLNPVRIIKNDLYEQIKQAELSGASADQLRELMGKGRSRKGIFEGDLQNGELEIGQVAATIHTIQSAAEIIQDMLDDYRQTLGRLQA